MATVIYKNVNRKNIKTSATVNSINNAEAFNLIVIYLFGQDYYNINTGSVLDSNRYSINDIIKEYKCFKYR